MKKILFISLIIGFFAATAAAETKPKIEFASTTHDLGTIKANGGRVTFSYDFTNTGDAPLLIFSVTNGGCGCTKPSFPKEPIMPGKKGKISITFDPTGRRGELQRTVLVDTNASKKRIKLKFTGAITPAPKK